MSSLAHILLQSLVDGPVLVTDLPEAASFCRRHLSVPAIVPQLNLQQKLGHLCEDALTSLLEASPQYELLARNLQIQNEARLTLGELDFLLRDLGNGQLIHLELAAKFYLAVETHSGLTLPGPDARDNYFQKLQRLRDHQLPLAKNHRDLLPDAYRHEPVATRQLIYGCLFDHILASRPSSPDFIQSNCRRGRWFAIDEYPDHFPPKIPIQVIPKALWPAPLELLADFPLEPWRCRESTDRCLMLRVDGEPLPYFVTPRGYPAYAAAR